MEILLVILFFLPIVGFLIFAAISPEEMVQLGLLGDRWKYKNTDLEPSEALIDYTRYAAIICLIVLAIVIIVYFLQRS